METARPEHHLTEGCAVPQRGLRPQPKCGTGVPPVIPPALAPVPQNSSRASKKMLVSSTEGFDVSTFRRFGVLAFWRFHPYRLDGHPITAMAVLIAAMIGLSTGCQRQAARIFEPLHRSIAERSVKRGDAMLVKADEPHAVSAFENALAHDPNNVVAHARLGRIHTEAGDYNRAAEHWRAALKLAPENRDYAIALAGSLDHQAATSIDRPQILRAAIRAYRHALWLDPDHLYAAMGLGRCLRQLGEFELAVNAFRDAERIDPSASVVHTELAATYADQRRYEQALAEYRLALKLDPDNLAAHNAAGEINMKLSRQPDTKQPLAKERALAHFRRSLQINPDQPRIHAMLADFQPTIPPVAVSIKDRDDYPK